MFFITLICEAFTTCWIFALGASFGSFLNVVVYRLPRGLTLFGGSHCPCCGQSIRFRDNIPILGWLLLRGRCRHCAQPIAARYWQVELTVALIWTSCAVVEIALGGVNLPGCTRPYWGFAFNLTWQNRDLILTACLHAALLMQMLMWSMIEKDGYPLPRLWSLGFLGLVLIVVGSCPAVHPACSWFPTRQANQGLHSATELLTAVCAGAYLSTFRSRTATEVAALGYAVFSLAAVCCSLGLAVLPAVLLIAGVLLRSASPRVMPLAGAAGIAAALAIACWRSVNAIQIRLGFADSAPGLILATTAVLVVVSLPPSRRRRMLELRQSAAET